MERTQEFRLNLTREDLKGLLNQMADQVFDFYIEQSEAKAAQERLVKTMPVKPKAEKVEETQYEEPFTSGAGNLIYHIDLVKAKQLQKQVKEQKAMIPKDFLYKASILKGTISSEGNKDTFKNTKSKIGIMSGKQRRDIDEALSLIGLDIDSIRATSEQVQASKAEKMKKAA